MKGAPKQYCGSGFFYGLALLNADRLCARGCQGVHHGRIETYYATLLSATSEQMPFVLPGLSAKEYRTRTRLCSRCRCPLKGFWVGKGLLDPVGSESLRCATRPGCCFRRMLDVSVEELSWQLSRRQCHVVLCWAGAGASQCEQLVSECL